MTKETKTKIENLINDNKIVLFMKGDAIEPRCGFSSQVVSILNSYGVSFKDVNILEDELVWLGVKEFSDWPTIPQLYINKEFIGGCDIINTMHQDGSLATKII
jgi:monothiol glutaredoxin